MPEPVIDPVTFQALKEMSGADFMPELIDTFLDDAPHMIGELRRTLAAGDVEAFRRTAHSFKSNCRTFGANQLAQEARELEFIARENRLADVRDKLDQLAADYAEVASALKGLRDG
jgi:HPt (histidine-containing phosphotransfer) domain-containing protein